MDVNRPPVTIRSKPVEAVLDAGRHWRAKLGFVVLAMEQTVEADVFRMTPENVGVHFTRMPMSNDVSLEALATMAPGIATAGSLLLPDDELDVICYTCNSGTMVIGEKAVMAALAGPRIGATTTVMTGVVRALEAIGARTISVATPYPDQVNGIVHGFLSSYGFNIAEFQGLNLKRNNDIDRVDPSFLREYARSVDRPQSDALFVCCGALRAVDMIADLEAEIGKPVIVSNQAMMWDCLRLAGLDDALPSLGCLSAVPSEAHAASVARLAARIS